MWFSNRFGESVGACVFVGMNDVRLLRLLHQKMTLRRLRVASANHDGASIACADTPYQRDISKQLSKP